MTRSTRMFFIQDKNTHTSAEQNAFQSVLTAHYLNYSFMRG